MATPYKTLHRDELREALQSNCFERAESAEGFALGLEGFLVRWHDRGPLAEPVAVPVELEADDERPGPRHRIEAWAESRGLSLAPTSRELREQPDRARLEFLAGGQISLSTDTHPSAGEAYDELVRTGEGLATDLAELDAEFVTLGSNPWHDPERIAARPSRAATLDLEQALDSDTGYALAALRTCAAQRVSIPFGGPVRRASRWRAAHLIAPVARAVFAASPLQAGQQPGGCSLRHLAWRHADPTGVGLAPWGEGEALEAYLEFGLAARVLWMLGEDGGRRLLPPGVTFAHWMEQGLEGLFPDLGDWLDHLDTLRPDVQPRGCIELNGADALPRAFWGAPATFWTALLTDDAALQASLDLLEGRAGASELRLEQAALNGLVDPDLAADARSLFALAADALLRLPEGRISRPMAASFVTLAQELTLLARTPADALVDCFAVRGALTRSGLSELEARWCAVAGVEPRRRSA